MAGVIYFVVPCFNEEEALPVTAQALLHKMRTLQAAGLVARESRVLFVDDGSRDNTWQEIESLTDRSPLFAGIRLAHNRGHQNALLAGLMAARERADAAVSMDADLQDDIDAVDQFVEAFDSGCDIVYGVRTNRDSDTFFKRFSAECFYRFLRSMGVATVFNHADYRLMSRRALDALADYREVNLFLRGIVPLIGFKTAVVPYTRRERVAGRSKYPLKKMLAFALDGITSFSTRPIRLLFWCGLAISLASTAAFLYVLAARAAGQTVPGWSSIACSIWFLGGVQLLALGVVGEYIGKIYAEVKRRPRYAVQEQAGLHPGEHPPSPQPDPPRSDGNESV